MISKFIVKTIMLAGIVGMLTASSMVSAQTQPVKPTGDVAGKSVSTKTTELAVTDKDEKTEPQTVTSTGEAITQKEELVAVNKETVPVMVPVERVTTPVAKTSGAGTRVVDSKTENATTGKQTSSGSDWEFAFAPYLFMSGISGTVGARGRVLEVDASFGNVLENLDIGVMGTLEARKGKFVFVSDLIWTKMSAERDTPGGLYDTAKVGINLFIFDPEVGYRVVDSEKGAFDVLGGVRIWSVENNLNLTTGLLPGFDVSQRKSWAAPVVGFRGLLNVSPKFFLSTKFDIGGAGIGADLTTQFYGGAGYRVTPKIALIGGYRYLQVDYDDSEGFLFDTKMNGFVFGAKFNF